jgi:hypothetical protein
MPFRCRKSLWWVDVSCKASGAMDTMAVRKVLYSSVVHRTHHYTPLGLDASGSTTSRLDVISGFRRDADEICSLLGYNAASSGNFLPTFRDNVSVPSSRVKKSRPLKMGPIRCPETSVKDYHSTLRYTPEERRSHRD